MKRQNVLAVNENDEKLHKTIEDVSALISPGTCVNDHQRYKMSTGSGPPRDRRVEELLAVNAVIYSIVCVLAAIGIVVTSIFLAVNIRFRHHRYFHHFWFTNLPVPALTVGNFQLNPHFMH